MEKNFSIYDILFLDIETVPLKKGFIELDETQKELWKSKTTYIQEKEGKTAEEVYEKAGIYAEFGKIICISVARLIKNEQGQISIRVKSFYGQNEKQILIDFSELLNKNKSKEQLRFCGHNSKEFDLPYICRRMIINSIQIPKTLDIQGKKPWEIYHVDTMEMWKFGDYKHYTSLQLLANILGIKSPKDDISGADVGAIYWIENDLERIKKYCEKDTVAVVQVYLRMVGKQLVEEENIIYVSD